MHKRETKKILSILVSAILLFSNLPSISIMAYPEIENMPENALYTNFTGHDGFLDNQDVIVDNSNGKITYANTTVVYDPANPDKKIDSKWFKDKKSRKVPPVINWKTVDGIFGKDTNDRSSHLHIDNFILDADYDGDGAPDYDYFVTSSTSPYLYVAPSSDKQALAEGESQVIMFDIAFGDFNVSRSFQLRDSSNSIPGFSISTNRNLKFLGEEIKDFKFERDKWYNFQIILTAGSEDGTVPNTATLYIDGKLVVDNKPFDSNTDDSDMTKFKCVSNFRINTSLVENKSTPKKYREVNTFYDNIYFASYKGDAQYTPSAITLTHTDPRINDMLTSISGSMDIKVNDSYTVADVLNGLSSHENLKSATVVDANGNLLSDNESIANSYLKIETNDNNTFYYKFTGPTPAGIMLWEEDFNVDDNVNLDDLAQIIAAAGKTSNPFSYNRKKIHTCELKGSLGGKTSDNKAATISYQGEYPSAGADRDPFYHFYINSYIGYEHTEPITVELSLYTKGNENVRFIVDASVDPNAETPKRILEIKENETIEFGGNSVNTASFKWGHEQWHKLAAVLYPQDSGTHHVEIYLDGEYMGSYNWDSTNFDCIGRIKVGYFITDDATDEEILLAIDDFKAYTGGYDAPEPMFVTSNISNVYVNESTRTISLLVNEIGDGVDAFDLLSVLEVSGGGTIQFFANNDFTQEIHDYIYDGMTLRLTSPDSSFYKYYSIREVKTDSFVPGIKSSDYKFDNAEKIISGVFKGTPVSVFLDKITFFEKQTVKVVSNGNVLTNTDYLINDAVLQITYEGQTVDYQIVYDIHIDEDFNEINIDYRRGDPSTVGNWFLTIPATESAESAFIRTEIPETRTSPAVRLWSKGLTPKDVSARNMGIQRKGGDTVLDLSNVVAIELSLLNNGPGVIHINGIHKQFGDSATKYISIFGLHSNGKVGLFPAKYYQYFEAGKWYRMHFIFDRNTGNYKFYVNGILTESGNNPTLAKIEYFQNLRIQHPIITGVEHDTWADDFKVFYAYDLDYYNHAGISTELDISSNYYSSSDEFGNISIHVQKGTTIGDIYNNITGVDGATFSILNADGTPITDHSTSVQDGMIIKVTSRDGLTERDYILTDEVLIEDINFSLEDDNKLTASVNIKNADNLNATLILAEYNNDSLVQVIYSQQTNISGVQIISESINFTEGNTVKAMLWSSITNIKPLTSAKEFNELDELDEFNE